MDYTKEYTNETERNENAIVIINHAQLYKRMLILCELVGMKGD